MGGQGITEAQMFQMGLGLFYVFTGEYYLKLNFTSYIPFLPESFTVGTVICFVVLFGGYMWLKGLFTELYQTLSKDDFNGLIKIFIPLIVPSVSIFLINMSSSAFLENAAFVYLTYSMTMTMTLLNLILATLS